MSNEAVKESLYLVFDQLPRSQEGGLVATYVNFVREFSSEIDITLVSVFGCDKTDIPIFEDLDVIELTRMRIDNRFPHALQYLHEGRIAKFLFALWSAIFFFLFIPLARIRSAKVMRGKNVIASSPAAAIFLSNTIDFVLEIHTSFRYFWEGGPVGRMQAALMAKPRLTLFRTKVDCAKAQPLFRSAYIYNGFDGKVAARDPWPVKRLPYGVVFVGRLTALKNPLMLLRCAARVREAVPEFTLDIVGDGELRAVMEAEVVRLGLQDVVTMHGYVDDKTLYQNYSLLWLTSLEEGFGLVLIEAMASGTPAVSTAWGDAVYEIIRNGETGFVASSEDDFVEKSITILNNPRLGEQLGYKARKDFDARFTTQHNREQWVRVLQQEFGMEVC